MTPETCNSPDTSSNMSGSNGDQAVNIIARDVWLVTNGPDGQYSQVVVGFEALKRCAVSSVFANPDDASDEANAMRGRLDDADAWIGDRWSIDWAFEDGYLSIQRITNCSALFPANVAALMDRLEDAGSLIDRLLTTLKVVEFRSYEPGEATDDEKTIRFEARPVVAAARDWKGR